ncbi:hypothetical protein B9Z55_012441 [Caenorhabditis nigoni]|uniref:Uncharacterized protein n=1 Tax=Caenorhabditis nigoni TaxID=1611254 RepID=A0A2G5TXB6_9PELO|nr:hypothetical protein B9Z55_012441 [Caenorhabditis nigoni]
MSNKKHSLSPPPASTPAKKAKSVESNMLSPTTRPKSPNSITNYFQAVKDTTVNTMKDADTLKMILKAMNTLIDENCELKKEIMNLKSTVNELQLSLVSKKTFAEAVAKGISLPQSQKSIQKAAINASETESRQSAIIIRQHDLNCNFNDEELAEKVTTACQVSKPATVFRLPGKPDAPPLIKIQMNSREDAGKILRNFATAKTTNLDLSKCSVRPNYTKQELVEYRNAWKEAIAKNDSAKKRVYTVRNFKVVTIQYKQNEEPLPWEIRETKA